MIGLYREVTALQRYVGHTVQCHVSAIGAREAGCFREVAALCSYHLRQVSLYHSISAVYERISM